QRVYRLALHIAQQEGADPFIVGVAALLHDLGRLTHDETRHHADLSVIHARDLLTRYQVPPDKQEAILHAIDAHSFSKGLQPRTLEARIVRDADRLDSL
ncbi:MAG: HD domain-containing protein, partial [Chloroflexi bacterium]